MFDRGAFLVDVKEKIERLAAVNGTYKKSTPDNPVPVSLISARSNGGRCIVIRGGTLTERLGLSCRLGIYDFDIDIGIRVKSRERFYKIRNEIFEFFQNAFYSSDPAGDYRAYSVVTVTGTDTSDLRDRAVDCDLGIDFTILEG